MESPDLRKHTAPSLPTYTVTRHTYGSEEFNFGDLYLPDTPGPHPIVPLLHGGFWRATYDLTLMDKLAAYLAHHGIAAWNIEYRRVGNKGGGWPGTLQDVAQAIDYLCTITTASNIDLLRIVPVGHSAGGHLALWLAARSCLPSHSPLAITKTPLALTGAISLAGVVDLELAWQLKLSKNAVRDFIGGSPAEMPKQYAEASPTALLPFQVPQVLIHGKDDTIVPLAISQFYALKAARAGDTVKIMELPATDHFAVIDPSSDAWAATMHELQLLLTPH